MKVQPMTDPMNPPALRDRDLAVLHRTFRRFPFVREVRLFGSRATGHARRAYVARAVSSLHKVRGQDGRLLGVLPKADGTLEFKPHHEFLTEIVQSTSAEWLRDFILSIGIVSNHGNWFTAENHNKEIMVLAQSYDWLLLTDEGLARFIQDVLLDPLPELDPARKAFLASYPKTTGENRFTKVRIDLHAHEALMAYFAREAKAIEAWFNVITPIPGSLAELRQQLETLARKDWAKIHTR
jgi:hypothetical protein